MFFQVGGHISCAAVVRERVTAVVDLTDLTLLLLIVFDSFNFKIVPHWTGSIVGDPRLSGSLFLWLLLMGGVLGIIKKCRHRERHGDLITVSN